MRVHGITWIVMYIFGCMTNSYYVWNHIGTHGIHSAELPVQLTSPPESTLFQSLLIVLSDNYGKVIDLCVELFDIESFQL